MWVSHRKSLSIGFNSETRAGGNQSPYSRGATKHYDEGRNEKGVAIIALWNSSNFFLICFVISGHTSSANVVDNFRDRDCRELTAIYQHLLW